MTSANFFNGYACDKPTSKVMAPPGGRSNNIFGSYEEPVQSNRAKVATNMNITEGNNSQQQPINQPPQQFQNRISGEQSSSNSGKSRRGFNPITGLPYDDFDNKKKTDHQPEVPPANQNQTLSPSAESKRKNEETTTAQEENLQTASGAPSSSFHPSTKVIHPPGGRSSGKLW